MERILWYFADPMCSWCYGFSPIIRQLVDRYRQRIPVSLVVGGLQPYTTDPMGAKNRDEILHHWHAVNEKTGALFQYDGILSEEFIYDTEPACRAAVTLPTIEPQATFPYFIRLQKAFYKEGRDITQADTLAEIATEFGIDKQEFLDAWNSDEVKQKMERNFAMTRQYGIRGFPTLVLQDRSSLELLSHGYASLEEIEPKLLAWLDKSESKI